jgi:hypothetical protein
MARQRLDRAVICLMGRTAESAKARQKDCAEGAQIHFQIKLQLQVLAPPKAGRWSMRREELDQVLGVGLAQRPLNTVDRGGYDDGSNQPNADF